MDMDVNESGGSAPPTGGHDTSIPPEVWADVQYICEVGRKVDQGWPPGTIFMRDAEHAGEGPPGIIIITNAEYAERAKDSRKDDTKFFSAQYSYHMNKEKRTCIWWEGSDLWLSEKSSGIMWLGVHGADSICMVTKKGDLDAKRLCGNHLKSMTVEEVLALFRKSVISEIEDLVDPSTKIRQSIQESIKKPFGVVSGNPGINNIHNESGNEASSAYEEKAIEFLKEKMNGPTEFTVAETMKTAVCAFQCLFPKKLKATEIEVSVMDPMYRVDDPKYGVENPEDESVDVTVWEVPTDRYEKYLDATDESGEALIISKK